MRTLDEMAPLSPRLAARLLVLLASTSALRLGPAGRQLSRAVPRMADGKTFLAGTSAAAAEEWDEAWGTVSFADLELKGVWDRTGKGKKRWAPGDTTGDAAVDASLLWSTWVMNRPDLYARDACPSCTATRFVLGHLGFPFTLVLEPNGASALPMLDGQGVPTSAPEGVGLEGALSICSFAAAHARKAAIPPATGREDVAQWLVEAAAGTSQLDALASMLLGVHPTDQSPCLNPWGFTVDDALVLPYLRNLKPTPTELEEWPAVVRAYLEMSCARCDVPLR